MLENQTTNKTIGESRDNITRLSVTMTGSLPKNPQNVHPPADCPSKDLKCEQDYEESPDENWDRCH